MRAAEPAFRHGVVLEAEGFTRGGRVTTSARGIVRWTFRFGGFSSASQFMSAAITYRAASGFGHLVRSRLPVLEDVEIRKTPRLTLRRAVKLLRAAGHRGGFGNVTLRNPLGPKRGNPLYIFGFAGGSFVAVDTVTKKVAPIS